MLSISFHWHCFSLLFPSSLLICTSLINCYYPSCHVWTYLVHSVQIHVSSVILLQVTHDELVWPDNPHFPNMTGWTKIKPDLRFCQLVSTSKYPFPKEKKMSWADYSVAIFSYKIFLTGVNSHMTCYNLNWSKIKLWVDYFIFSCALDHIL